MACSPLSDPKAHTVLGDSASLSRLLGLNTDGDCGGGGGRPQGGILTDTWPGWPPNPPLGAKNAMEKKLR